MSSIVTGFLVSICDIVTLLLFHEKLSSNNNAVVCSCASSGIRFACSICRYNLPADDIHIRNTTSDSFNPIPSGIFLLRSGFDYSSEAGAGKPRNVSRNDANRTFWTATAWKTNLPCVLS